MPPSAVSSFRWTVWDPLLLSSQIICLQSALYALLGLLFLFTNAILGIDSHLGLLFDFRQMRLDTVTGWVVSLWTLSAGCFGWVSFFCRYFIQRRFHGKCSFGLLHLGMVALNGRCLWLAQVNEPGRTPLESFHITNTPPPPASIPDHTYCFF